MAMGRHRPRLRCWLVAFGGTLACWAVSAVDLLPQQVEHPFRNLAAWLRKASPDMMSADQKAISRGITVLSNSQSYVKSFDGMAYELKGKIKDGGSTADIDTLREEAELHESKSSSKKAVKLIKLLIEVERALNSAEASEIAAQSNPSRAAQYMKDAGLRFLPEPPPPPPPPAEDRNATASTGASGVTGDNGEGIVGSVAPPTTKVSRDKQSRSKTRSKVATKAVKPSAAERRRPSSSSSSSSSSSAAAVAAAEGRRGVDGGNGAGQKNKEKENRRNAKGEERADVSRRWGSDDGSAGAVPGGEPPKVFVVTVAGCEVRCLLMLEEREGEGGRLVVAIGDSLTGEALLQSLFEEPAMVQLASHGLMRETAYVNRVAFQSACDILEWAGPYIKASLEVGGAFEGFRVHCAGHSFGGAVAACLAGLLDGVIDVEALGGNDKSGGVGGSKKKGSGRGVRAAEAAATKVRKQQRSAGVAGERGDTSRDRQKPFSSEGSDERGEEGDTEVRVDEAVPWVGICPGKVTCVTLGCPPCLSQNLRLPFVTSFVLGDDMVPRTSHESLQRLKQRLLQVMPKGKGFLSQGMAFSTSLFTDVAGVAMQGVRQATTLGEDDARLSVPGRVWFAKPRRLKNGATLSRVLQGNIKEDMLWQLHDIMLTKSMLSHHRLDKYIKILDRV